MTDTTPQEGDGPSQRSVEIGVALATLFFAGVVLAGAWQAGVTWGSEGPRAGFFPFYVGLLLLIAAVVNLVQALAIPSRVGFAAWGQLWQVLSVVVPTAVYVALIPWAGFYLASFLLIAVFMRWLGRYRWTLVLAVSLGVPLFTFLLFERWFLIPLPKGPVEEMLGF